MSNNRRRPPKTKQADPDPELTNPPAEQSAAIVVPNFAKGQLSEVVRRNLERIPGSSRKPQTVNALLAWCAKNTHLVTPAARVGTIPEGCSVAFVVLWCNPESAQKGGDCFPVSNNFMPAKHFLDQVAGAAGVKWDPQLGGRVDDGSNPHYCHYKAVGHVTHFDGTEAVLVREKQMDLRDGSPFISKLIKDAENAKDKRGNPRPRDPSNQIIELRGFILEHAESKAKNRVVRSLGMKTSYTKEELLSKPFVVAKLMFTGETDDPELRRHFAELRAQKMLGGTRALFGVPTTPQLGHGTTGRRPPPPPVGAAGGMDPEDDLPFFGDEPDPISHPNVIDAPTTQPSTPNPTPAPAQGGGNGTAGGDGNGGDGSGVVIPGGDKKGMAIEDESVTVEDLIYWAGRIEDDINNGNSRRVDYDTKRAKAMRDEIDWREGRDPNA